MAGFTTDGFLSTEIADFERAIAARYSTKLQLARDTNRLAHEIMYSIKPRNHHSTDLMLASLLTRQASAFQGFLILLNKGLETQAQILLRNLVEMMFITGAIRKDETFIERYVLSEECSRLKSLEAIVRDKRSRREDIDSETTRLIEELRETIKREEPETFTTARIAEIAGLLSYYDNLYRFTSMAVHASPRELNSAFTVDGDGTVVSIRYEPTDDDLDMYLDYAVSVMLYILHELASHFVLNFVDRIEALQHANRESSGPTRTEAEKR